MQYRGGASQSIAFLKRTAFPVLDLKVQHEGWNLSHQIQIINLSFIGEDKVIFDMANTYVDYALIPFFSSYKNKKLETDQ